MAKRYRNALGYHGSFVYIEKQAIAGMPKAQGLLKATQQRAWTVAPPQPKSTPAGTTTRKVKPHETGVKPNLGSKNKFYSDMLKGMGTQQRDRSAVAPVETKVAPIG